MATEKQLLRVIQFQTDLALSAADLGSVVALVAERTVDLLESDGAVVELAEGDEMVYRAAAGIAEGFLGLRLPMAGSLSGLCVAEGVVLVCDDTEDDPRVNRDACRRVGLRSMLVVPLRYRGETVGVLKAASSQPRFFEAGSVRLLSMLSDAIAARMAQVAHLDRDELFYKATHDDLTGLANRALFMDRLRSELAQRERAGGKLGVVMIDMNGLKRINDTLGHAAGDAALREVATRIREACRATDTAARLGGDEFAVLLTLVEATGAIDAFGARVVARLDAPFAAAGQALALSASVGGVVFPDEGATPAVLLERADQRMCATKRAFYGVG